MTMTNTGITNRNNTIGGNTANQISKGEIIMTDTRTRKQGFKTRIIAGILSAVTVFSAAAFAATSASAAETDQKIVVTFVNGEKSYDNIEDAWRDATGENESTVKLNDDISGVNNLDVRDGATVKFDLNGHTINANGKLFHVMRNGKFTLVNGKVSNASTAVDADGAIVMNGVTVTGATNSAVRLSEGVKLEITGCTFKDNKGDRGGAIYMPGKEYSGIIRNNTFIGNSAAREGGAVFGPKPIKTSRFVDNKAGTDGGAVYCFGKNEGVYESTLENNHANGNGGAVLLAENFTRVHRCTVANNTAGGNGGGIYSAEDKDAVVFACKVFNNTAGGDGGGIYVSKHSVLHLASTKFTDNTANGKGGGIFLGALSSSNHNFSDSEITGNKASTAGGVYADAGCAKAADIDVFGKVIVKDNINNDLYLVKSWGKKAKVYTQVDFDTRTSCIYVNSSESGERAVAELYTTGHDAGFRANGGRKLERGSFYNTTLYIE